MSYYTNDKSTNLLLLYLPPEEQKKLGIQLKMDLNYQKLDRVPDSRLGYLQSIVQEARDDNKGIILCDVTIDSPTGTTHPVTGKILQHSVAMKIDLQHKKIIYQDPKGYSLFAVMAADLKTALPEFEIKELKVQQQGEHNPDNCGPLTVENLRRLAHFDDVVPYMDVESVRRQHDEDLSTISGRKAIQ